MTIKYPVSFILMLVLGGFFTAMTVAYSVSHLLVMMVPVGLLPVFRLVCHWEGRTTRKVDDHKSAD